MILSVDQYRETFHPAKSVRTVYRMVKYARVPSNHIVYKFRDYVIEVRSLNENAQNYLDAISEFNNRKGDKMELCAELSVRYKIEMTRLCKLVAAR